MVTIKLFGSLRLKTGFKEMQVYASSVSEACALMARATGWNLKEFKNCVFSLNGTQVKYSAKLKDGDELIFLSPSGGG